ncbi:hypothetical protein HanRHA438_Chr16g0780821 [Helianthus annuus]|nr:hypothetical protein HanRHA438_Chr16g0780821 [Helianthus annuus]
MTDRWTHRPAPPVNWPYPLSTTRTPFLLSSFSASPVDRRGTTITTVWWRRRWRTMAEREGRERIVREKRERPEKIDVDSGVVCGGDGAIFLRVGDGAAPVVK